MSVTASEFGETLGLARPQEKEGGVCDLPRGDIGEMLKMFKDKVEGMMIGGGGEERRGGVMILRRVSR